MAENIAEPRQLLSDCVGDEVLRASSGDRLVVSPTDEQQIADLLACCSANAIRVVPTGGAGWRDPHPHDPRPVVWLSTGCLGDIIEFSAPDHTITVQAGLPLAELNRAAGQHHLVYPVDAPEPAATTVGSVIAADVCGVRARRRGTIADHLLGATMVTPAHGAIRAGAATVKSVAGYDVHRLMVGSAGMFGVLTQVTLRLVPQPETTAVALVVADGHGQARHDLATIIRGRSRPAMLDLLDSAAAEDLDRFIEPDQVLLSIAYEGDVPTVSWQLAALGDDLGRAVEPLAGADAAAWCQRSRDWSVQPDDFAFEARVRADRCPSLVSFCHRAGIAVIARPGCGVVHGRKAGTFDASDILALRAAAGEQSTVVLSQWPVGCGIDPWPILPLAGWLRRIKQVFDPADVLPAPGLLPLER